MIWTSKKMRSINMNHRNRMDNSKTTQIKMRVRKMINFMAIRK